MLFSRHILSRNNNELFRKYADELGPYTDTIDNVLLGHVELIPVRHHPDIPKLGDKFNKWLRDRKSSVDEVLAFRKKPSARNHGINIKILFGHTWFLTTTGNKEVEYVRWYNMKEDVCFELITGQLYTRVTFPLFLHMNQNILYAFRLINLYDNELPRNIMVLRSLQLLDQVSEAGLEDKILNFHSINDVVTEEINQRGRGLRDFQVLFFPSMLSHFKLGTIPDNPKPTFFTIENAKLIFQISQLILKEIAERIRRYKCYPETLSGIQLKCQNYSNGSHSMVISA